MIETEPPPTVKHVYWALQNAREHPTAAALAAITVGAVCIGSVWALLPRTDTGSPPNRKPTASIRAPQELVSRGARTIPFSGAESADDSDELTFEWFVNEVSVHEGESFRHRFEPSEGNTEPTEYEVWLLVTDEHNESDKAVLFVTVYPERDTHDPSGTPLPPIESPDGLDPNPWRLTREELLDAQGFDQDGKLEFDRNYEGDSARGVFMHPATTESYGAAEFSIPAGATHFQSTLTVSGPRCGDSYGDFVGEVSLYDLNGWRRVWQGSVVSYTESNREVLRQTVNVPVGDADRIRLKIRTGLRVWCEKAIWQDARFTSP